MMAHLASSLVFPWNCFLVNVVKEPELIACTAANVFPSTGKVRLSKWFATTTAKERSRILKDVSPLVLSRKVRLCNVIEYKGQFRSRALKSDEALTVLNRQKSHYIHR